MSAIWAKQALKEAQISAVEGALMLKLSSGLKRLENVPNDQKDSTVEACEDESGTKFKGSKMIFVVLDINYVD